MIRSFRSCLLAALCGLVFAGCASGPAGEERPREHVVARGESLQVIAWRYGLDLDDLVRWNRIANPNRIRPGQRLLLTPDGGPVLAEGSRRSPESVHPAEPSGVAAGRASPADPARRATMAAAGELAAVERSGPWRWPMRGQILRRFEPDTPGRKGVQIGGELGQPVMAAKAGEVVYGGSGLPGYGRLIIVKHSESLLSAYGFLGKILVNEGDRVNQGQVIGEVGTSSENRPALHFEIRQNGKPVDPLRFLPG